MCDIMVSICVVISEFKLLCDNYCGTRKEQSVNGEFSRI